jgi:polar amino acid transport system substrate-binding protein
VIARLLVVCMVVTAGFWSTSAHAQTSRPGAAPEKAAKKRRLKVGISAFSPFVFTDRAKPYGFSIELWRTVSRKLGVEYDLVTYHGVKDKLAALRAGTIDIAIGGVTLTKAREAEFDFTHPTFHTGLDILVRADDSSSFAALRDLFSVGKLPIIIGFLLLIVIAGHLMWFAERGKDAFNDRYFPGVFEGMYWAIVTASTVGYGDKAPVKWSGRLLAGLTIIVALPLFAIFTAAITSSFTVKKLQSSITGPSDLHGKRVGVIRGTSSAEYITNYQPRRVFFAKIDRAADALVRKQIDAVVYDAPNLDYYAKNRGEGRVSVVGKLFLHQRYAIALPAGAKLRENINIALLSLNESNELRLIREHWFGKKDD